MNTAVFLTLVSAAAGALKDRKEEVNKLNVFPVPDGDTGTNMSLTMDAVVGELSRLDEEASLADACQAVTHGSLMGARGNSGVILSQVLRGLCEVAGPAETFDAAMVAAAFERSTTVAFQAVRKPVEGTMLTVLKDSSAAAAEAAEAGMEPLAALERIAAAAFDSVRRTPELLPVLKENGVVDAGGYGLAILLEGFVAAAAGHEVTIADVSSAVAPMLAVEPVDDWDDEEYLYCTEFLLFGEDLDKGAITDFVVSKGGSELVVGDDGMLKVHVHTDEPGAVLAHMTQQGEVAEVHINNMRRQTRDRDAKLAADKNAAATPVKPVGFVAVAAGEGLAKILRSLGADVIVSGGQTMNPSTQDILDAVRATPAERVIVLPNNKNIIMAATAASTVAEKPVAVVPTTSVPEAFSALLAYDGSDDVESIVAAMTEAAAEVRTGEVTTAVKDAKGKVGDIRAGQVIGIADHEIEVTGDDVSDVAVRLAGVLLSSGEETLTVLAGADFSDEALDDLVSRLEVAYPDAEVESHRGEQPLYPVILSAE